MTLEYTHSDTQCDNKVYTQYDTRVYTQCDNKIYTQYDTRVYTVTHSVTIKYIYTQ